MIFISVDCGCTNMRCRLFSDGELLSEIKIKGGGSTTALTGSNEVLKQNLRRGLRECLEKGGLQEKDVEIVLLSGTITSAVGVYHAHHRRAPVGPEESAKGSEYVVLPEISSIPMLYIPGVRTDGDNKDPDFINNIDSFDSMSGEECECYGVSQKLGLRGNFTLALPGSYMKVFYVNGDGKICSMSTGMCGEFMTAIAENSLLKCTLPHPVLSEIVPEKLCEGFRYADARGVSTALAKSRIVNLNCGYSIAETANFFAGAALHDDICATLREVREGSPLIIGGSDPIRHAIYTVIKDIGCKASEIIEIDNETANFASVIGQKEVYRWYKKIKDIR